MFRIRFFISYKVNEPEEKCLKKLRLQMELYLLSLLSRENKKQGIHRFGYQINQDKLSINSADVQKDRNTTNKSQRAEIGKKQ